MSAHHQPADCDQVHDTGSGVSVVINLTPVEAEAAAILRWPVTAYRSGPRARLTIDQQAVLAGLIAWRQRTRAEPT